MNQNVNTTSNGDTSISHTVEFGVNANFSDLPFAGETEESTIDPALGDNTQLKENIRLVTTDSQLQENIGEIIIDLDLQILDKTKGDSNDQMIVESTIDPELCDTSDLFVLDLEKSPKRYLDESLADSQFMEGIMDNNVVDIPDIDPILNDDIVQPSTSACSSNDYVIQSTASASASSESNEVENFDVVSWWSVQFADQTEGCTNNPQIFNKTGGGKNDPQLRKKTGGVTNGSQLLDKLKRATNDVQLSQDFILFASLQEALANFQEKSAADTEMPDEELSLPPQEDSQPSEMIQSVLVAAKINVDDFSDIISQSSEVQVQVLTPLEVSKYSLDIQSSEFENEDEQESDTCMARRDSTPFNPNLTLQENSQSSGVIQPMETATVTNDDDLNISEIRSQSSEVQVQVLNLPEVNKESDASNSGSESTLAEPNISHEENSQSTDAQPMDLVTETQDMDISVYSPATLSLPIWTNDVPIVQVLITPQEELKGTVNDASRASRPDQQDQLQRDSVNPLCESVLLAQALAAYDEQRFEDMYTIIGSINFSPCHHKLLQEKWYNARYQEASSMCKRPLSSVDKHRQRSRYPLPHTIWDGEDTKYCFSVKTRNLLLKYYKINKWPTSEQKEELLTQTELNSTQISNWFRNHRQREKRQEKSTPTDSVTESKDLDLYNEETNVSANFISQNSSSFDSTEMDRRRILFNSDSNTSFKAPHTSHIAPCSISASSSYVVPINQIPQNDQYKSNSTITGPMARFTNAHKDTAMSPVYTSLTQCLPLGMFNSNTDVHGVKKPASQSNYSNESFARQNELMPHAKKQRTTGPIFCNSGSSSTQVRDSNPVELSNVHVAQDMNEKLSSDHGQSSGYLSTFEARDNHSRKVNTSGQLLDNATNYYELSTNNMTTISTDANKSAFLKQNYRSIDGQGKLVQSAWHKFEQFSKKRQQPQLQYQQQDLKPSQPQQMHLNLPQGLQRQVYPHQSQLPVQQEKLVQPFHQLDEQQRQMKLQQLQYYQQQPQMSQQQLQLNYQTQCVLLQKQPNNEMQRMGQQLQPNCQLQQMPLQQLQHPQVQHPYQQRHQGQQQQQKQLQHLNQQQRHQTQQELQLLNLQQQYYSQLQQPGQLQQHQPQQQLPMQQRLLSTNNFTTTALQMPDYDNRTTGKIDFVQGQSHNNMLHSMQGYRRS